MKTTVRILVLAVAVAGLAEPAAAQLLPSFGRDRAGTSGFQFLKIPVDARSAALGQTVAATATDASSLFWNPALAAQTGRMEVGFGHTAYYADLSIDYLSAIFQVGTIHFGLSVQALNSGSMDVTTEFQPFGTGETFRFIDLAAGLTVAQELTDLFSYGVTARYVREGVAGVTTQTALFDLGVFYRIGNTGARMAVAIRNFGLDGVPTGDLERRTVDSADPVIVSDFEGMTPPTTFLLGFSYELLQSMPDNAVTVSAQLSNPNDNAESFNIGTEYVWRSTLMLRMGYRFGVEEVRMPSFGLGLMVPGIGPKSRFDYAFTQMSRLGAVHRAGINVSL